MNSTLGAFSMKVFNKCALKVLGCDLCQCTLLFGYLGGSVLQSRMEQHPEV